MEKLNNDIYDITGMVTDIEQRYVYEEDPDTLALSLFGAFADVEALNIQNAIISTGELGNELFPARAKYERNLLSHAVVNNVENINAVPSHITCVLEIFETDFDKYAENDMFYLDKEIAFNINNMEFHLDYDIIIRKNYIANNGYAYTAQYNIDIDNPLSDITNIYLNAPFIQLYNGSKMICFYTQLRQVAHSSVPKRIITNNLIENKTLQFNFNNQLANFIVKATDGDTVTYITPVLEGVGIEQGISTYCYYSYLDASHIKVRFDSSSYIPKLNTDIEIVLKTTKGASGKFEYNQTIYPTVSSEKYKYSNVPIVAIFGGESEGGLDRISIGELRKILPKESLSRGNITCRQDVDNYFSKYNTDESRMITRKRVDNQFERSYYIYLLLKDLYENVIPTNTFNIKVARSAFDTHDNRKYVLKPGCYILLDTKNDVGNVIKRSEANGDELDDMEENDKTTFLYTVPFMIIVTGDPLYVSYYLALMNESKFLDFTYINMDSVLQFITVNLSWKRGFVKDSNKYKLSFGITKNYEYPSELVTVDENGVVIDSKVKAFVVFYNSDNSSPYRYIETTISYPIPVEGDDKDTSDFIMSGELETTDTINDDNKVKILNTYVPGSTTLDYGYFSKDLSVRVYLCVKLEEGEFGRYDLDGIVPGLEGWTVCNMYTVEDGLSLYKNYSEIIHSQAADITISTDYDDELGFSVTSVPCVRKTYTDSEENMLNLVSEIDYKKAYIDNARTVLDSNMSIDFKFYCTYGPSKTYYVDKEKTIKIDRCNLSINFALKLVSTADKNTKNFIIDDIKTYIEDLNDISSLHIPNLITQITTNYRQLIEYFEFLGFNDYGPGCQHLYHEEVDDVFTTPEFLTVHTNMDLSPDISIRLD